MKISPGRIIKNTGKHLSSAKIKESLLEKAKNNKQTGKERPKVKQIPAVITLRFFVKFPSALYLVINLETVIGVPEQITVKISPKTERAT